MKISARKVFSPAALIAVLLILTSVFIAQNPFLKDQSGLSRWVEPTGVAYSAPACGSSDPMVTCSGSNVVVNFTWQNHGDVTYQPAPYFCNKVEILVKKSNQQNYTSIAGNQLPCAGTYQWTEAEKNKTYNYAIRTSADQQYIPYEGPGWHFYTYSGNGPILEQGSFNTPNCNQGAPTISISVVGSNGETATVGSNQTVTFPIVMGDPEFTWSSSGADACSWSPAGWAGLSGVRSSIIYNPVDYTLTCTNTAGSTFGTVHITAIPQSSSSSSSGGGGASSSSSGGSSGSSSSGGSSSSSGGSSSSSGGSSGSSSSGGAAGGSTAQCQDGIDNDGDGEIDFPNDPGCASLNDNSEVNTPNWREIIPPSS